MLTRNLIVTLMVIIAFVPVTIAEVSQDLQNAAHNGKVAFVIIAEPGAQNLEQARSLVSSAASTVKNAIVLEVNRKDSKDAPFIVKYGLATVPIPLIMVFSSKGTLGGGILSEKASVDLLVHLVPSPKTEEVLKSLQAGHSVLITATRKGMAKGDDAVSRCAAACGKLSGKADLIQIDLRDKQESYLLQQLRIDPQTTEPVTVVINARGQVTGSYTGLVDTANLIQSATRVASGCCPPGSGKTCGPTGK